MGDVGLERPAGAALVMPHGLNGLGRFQSGRIERAGLGARTIRFLENASFCEADGSSRSEERRVGKECRL